METTMVQEPPSVRFEVQSTVYSAMLLSARKTIDMIMKMNDKIIKSQRQYDGIAESG